MFSSSYTNHSCSALATQTIHIQPYLTYTNHLCSAIPTQTTDVQPQLHNPFTQSITILTQTIHVQPYWHKPFMFSLTDTNYSCSAFATQTTHFQPYLHKPFMFSLSYTNLSCSTLQTQTIQACSALPTQTIHVCSTLPTQTIQVCSTLPTQAFRACSNYPFMYVQPTQIIQARSTWQTLTCHVPASTPAHGTGPTQTRLPVWCKHHVSTRSSNSKSRKCNNAEHNSTHNAMCKPFFVWVCSWHPPVHSNFFFILTSSVHLSSSQQRELTGCLHSKCENRRHHPYPCSEINPWYLHGFCLTSLTAGQPGQLSLCSVPSTRSAPIMQALLPFSSHRKLYNSTKNNSLYWIEAWGFHTLMLGYLIINKQKL